MGTRAVVSMGETAGSGVPHWGQNFFPALKVAPHEKHCTVLLVTPGALAGTEETGPSTSGLPHCLQNLFSGGYVIPQLAQ